MDINEGNLAYILYDLIPGEIDEEGLFLFS